MTQCVVSFQQPEQLIQEKVVSLLLCFLQQSHVLSSEKVTREANNKNGDVTIAKKSFNQWIN